MKERSTPASVAGSLSNTDCVAATTSSESVASALGSRRGSSRSASVTGPATGAPNGFSGAIASTVPTGFSAVSATTSNAKPPFPIAVRV